jgi:hypothetical protein
MSYEYMTGLGQATVAAQGQVMAPVPTRTAIPTITGALFSPKVPSGSVSTFPEERDWLKKWICQVYGNASSICGRSSDPKFTYMDAGRLAKFRNAQRAQFELSKEQLNPATTGIANVNNVKSKFFTWWKRCHKWTWAMWMISPGFGTRMVPKGAWDYFVGPLRQNVNHACVAAQMDSLFKMGTQWSTSKLLGEQQERERTGAPAPVAPSITPTKTGFTITGKLFQPRGPIILPTPERDTVVLPTPSDEPVVEADTVVVDENGEVVFDPEVIIPTDQGAPPFVDENGEPVIDENGEPVTDEAAMVIEEGFFARNKWFIGFGALAILGGGAAWWWLKKKKEAEMMANMLPPPKSPRHPAGLEGNLYREVL